MNAIHGQSADIAAGVDKGSGLDVALGAGDQGLMFGYACKQTDAYMPVPIHYSHQLMQRCAQLRKSGELPYLRPDAKAQVSVEYEGRSPKRVHTVVLSTQHDRCTLTGSSVVLETSGLKRVYIRLEYKNIQCVEHVGSVWTPGPRRTRGRLILGSEPLYEVAVKKELKL